MTTSISRTALAAAVLLAVFALTGCSNDAAPADGTGASVGPALNRAANQVALDFAKWIGSSGS